MMQVPSDEVAAIREVLRYGDQWGYGNLIAHLQTAWARSLIDRWDMAEEAARRASGGPGYPFALQADVLERGQWDETGHRYAEHSTKR